jgi:pyruvate,water dikinase
MPVVGSSAAERKSEMFAKWFEQLGKDMFEECGGKAAHLGELTKLHLSVPNGFSILGHAYYHHLDVSHLREPIDAIAGSINFDDLEDLEKKARVIRELILRAPVPAEIEQEIVDCYSRLSQGGDSFVAVRSSVAIKDSPISSFPGMMDTFHYVQGPRNVVDKVRECWASVWSTRAAFTRHSKNLEHNKAIIAPTIQLMVNADIAGVLFTVNPVNGSKEEIVIESNWGLGETVVCGRCQSDFYVMRKLCNHYGAKLCTACPPSAICIANQKIAKKYETYLQAEGGGTQWTSVPAEKVSQPTLTERQIHELCHTACVIEAHYSCHQDIEWAYENGNLYILQARRARVGGE